MQDVNTQGGVANPTHDNTRVKKEVRTEKQTPNNCPNNAMNNSKILQKSQEILRKRAKKAGQIFQRVILTSELRLHN